MKKILISLIAFSALFANANDEIKQLKKENEQLKQRLEALENRLSQPFASFFDDFDNFFEQRLQSIQKIGEFIEKELKNTEKKENLEQNFSSFFKSGDVISQVKQNIVKNKDENTKKTEFKTYNSKNKKEYEINDIFKDFNDFNAFLKSKFPELKVDNFYINNDGFTFSTSDLLNKARVNFEEVKKYLKDDFLKDLGI